MEHKLLHTTAVVLTLLTLVTAQITVTSPSTMEASIKTSRLDDSATTQSTSSHATSNLTLKTPVAQSLSPTPSTDLQSTTSGHSEATSPALPPSPHTTSKTTQEPPTGPTPTPQEQRVEISLSFHITNRVFNDSLSNRSSEAFQELEKTIGDVYQAVYNCSACENDYVGYRVNKFRNGSVVAYTQINFRKNSNTTSHHFLSVVEDSLKNASHEALKGLNLTDVTAQSVSPTPSTDLQSTTSGHSEATSPALPPSPHTTSKTTQEPPTGPTPTPQEQRVEISLSFHITNRVFNDSLSNRSSEAFQELERTIGEVYQAVYNCSACENDYVGYRVNEFRNGSVVADTQIYFRKNSNTTSHHFLSVAEDSLKNASHEALKGLNLTDVTAQSVSPTPSTDLQSTTSGHSEATSPALPPSPHTTSKTTQEPPIGPTPTPQEQRVKISLSFRITNRVFNDSLSNRSSEAFQELERTIGEVYQAVYNCSACENDYVGYRVNEFRNGSVVADTQIYFRKNSNTTSHHFLSVAEDSLKNASHEALKGLNLTDVTAQSVSPTPSTDLQSTTSGHSEATSPALPPSPHTTSKTTQEPPIGPTPTPQEQRVKISLSFRITNRVFNDSLSNRSSEAFQELERTIGEVYQAVYNCSACENDYVGYRVNEFRNGSVVADTQIYFRKNSNTTSHHFLSVAEDSLKNASHEALKGLNLTDVTAQSVSPTPSTDLQSTTSGHSEATSPALPPSPHTTSKTTQEPPIGPTPTPQEQRVKISLSFRITNRVFNDSLSNRSSEAFQELERTIGEVYQAVYNCSACKNDYVGYRVNEFRNGSVVADTQIYFRKNSNTTSHHFLSVVEDSLKNASHEALKGLNLTDVTAQSVSPTPSTDLQSTTSGHSEATSPALPPSPHTTSKTTQEPPIGPTPTPQEQRVKISLSFRITNRVFNDSLSNRSSEAFQELERTIGEVYQAVYNCSACENDYVGYRVNEFRNGSVVADTQIYFRKNSNTTSHHFLSVVEDSLKNASHEALKGLNLTDVTVQSESPTPSTDLQSTTSGHSEATSPALPPSPHTTSKTTQEPPTGPTPTPQEQRVEISLSFRITNRVFNDSLSNRSSEAFQELERTIGEVYQAVYNCATCEKDYVGYLVNDFRNGSVVADTQINFRKNPNTASRQFPSVVEDSLKNASNEALKGLKLTDVTATAKNNPPTPSSTTIHSEDTSSHTTSKTTQKPNTTTTVSPESLPSTSSSSASDVVPGWGIALLVLVCIILLIALVALLLLIIYWCRRHHRGSLNLLSSRDSYHPMNEYPTYHTHGRYAAPSSKQNPYNETLPKNGTSPFSYTNPAMANDNL